jgi:hypothetical protein
MLPHPQLSANAALLARRNAAVARGVATAAPLFAARASNAELWDVEGARYIDFASGIGVLATGHLHPRVIAAVQAQLQCFSHTAFQVMAYELYIELAERLNGLAPFKEPARSDRDSPLSRDCLRRCISWQNDDDYGAYGESRALQKRLRAARIERIPTAVSCRTSRNAS